jgi:hypothetical protein
VLFLEEGSAAPYLRVTLADQADPVPTTAQLWTGPHTLVVGTARGELALYQHARLAGSLPLPLPHPDAAPAGAGAEGSSAAPLSLPGSPVAGVVAVDAGLLVVTRAGQFALLSAGGTGHTHTQTQTLPFSETAEQPASAWACVATGAADWPDAVRCVASPGAGAGAGVCVSTDSGQLLRVWGWAGDAAGTPASPWGGLSAAHGSVGLASLPLTLAPPVPHPAAAGAAAFPVCFAPVVAWAHAGSITGLDVCARAGVAVTCGVDHTLRVWSLTQHSLLFATRFPEPPLAVALHPSGWMLLVSFPERVCLCMRLHRSLRVVQEWPLKHAAELAFAHGGHLFAVSAVGAVHIVNTFTGQTLHALRSHVGAVRALAWAADDNTVVSAGADGDVQERAVSTGARVREFVQKGCRFLGAAVGSDGAVLVCGDDQVLKQLSARGVAKALDAGVVLTQLALASTATGVLRSFAYPLTGDAKDYQCHRGAVTRLRLCEDDALLASAGEDACLALWSVRSARAGTRGARSGAALCEDVAVSVSAVEELRGAVQSLEARLRELAEERESEEGRLAAAHEQQLRELTEENVLRLENGRARMEADRDEGQERDAANQEKLLALHAEHSAELREQLDEAREARAAAKKRQEQEQAAEAQRLRATLQEQVQRAVVAREAAEAAHAQVVARFAEDRAQTEQDLDTEVELLAQRYRTRLESERDAALRLKGDTGLVGKKHQALVSDCDDLAEAKAALQVQDGELRAHLQVLRGKLAAQREAIAASDQQLAEREQQVQELKRGNHALQRHRFVVGFQVSELKREIAPCEAAVARLQAAVGALSGELEQAHQRTGRLAAEASAIGGKLVSARAAVKQEQGQVRLLLRECNEMCLATTAAVQVIQQPEMLVEAATQLVQKYGSGPAAGPSASSGSQDVAQEYRRHVAYLSASVNALRAQGEAEAARGRKQTRRLMRENNALIREINAMRRDLKQGAPGLRGPGARPAPSKASGGGLGEDAELAAAKAEVRRNAQVLERLRAEIEQAQQGLQ